MQNELPLDVDLVTLMGAPDKSIGWRRAHFRNTEDGKRVTVGLSIINGDGGEREEMLRRQLPASVRRPTVRTAMQESMLPQ